MFSYTVGDALRHGVATGEVPKISALQSREYSAFLWCVASSSDMVPCSSSDLEPLAYIYPCVIFGAHMMVGYGLDTLPAVPLIRSNSGPYRPDRIYYNDKKQYARSFRPPFPSIVSAFLCRTTWHRIKLATVHAKTCSCTVPFTKFSVKRSCLMNLVVQYYVMTIRNMIS